MPLGGLGANARLLGIFGLLTSVCVVDGKGGVLVSVAKGGNGWTHVCSFFCFPLFACLKKRFEVLRHGAPAPCARATKPDPTTKKDLGGEGGGGGAPSWTGEEAGVHGKHSPLSRSLFPHNTPRTPNSSWALVGPSTRSERRAYHPSRWFSLSRPRGSQRAPRSLQAGALHPLDKLHIDPPRSLTSLEQRHGGGAWAPTTTPPCPRPRPEPKVRTYEGNNHDHDPSSHARPPIHPPTHPTHPLRCGERRRVHRGEPRPGLGPATE